MQDQKPNETGMKHTLPFAQLAPHHFERLCLWLVEREGYDRVEHLGAAGSDQGLDIVAWRGGKKWGFQCKRVKRFGPKTALKELEKVLALPETERPEGLTFIIACVASATTRREARAACEQSMRCDFWAVTELDARVKSHPEIVEEFFQINSSLEPAPRNASGKVTKVRVFMASSGDSSEEQVRLREVIAELNRGIAEDKGFVLQLSEWVPGILPSARKDRQNLASEAIGPYDILVGVLWKRFNTRTRACSGTEEEFEKALNWWLEYGRPYIMFYFSNAPFFPASTDEIEQVTRVLDFKRRAEEKQVLCWEYDAPEQFERLVRQHLTQEIRRWADYNRPAGQPRVIRLPLQVYQVLFNELDMYITHFEQLKRDYTRELRGEQIVFAADFSELHDYMYPYRPGSYRSSINRYAFDRLEDPFTLMPGAVGELLTDLERAMPSSDVLAQDPLTTYEDVARFVYDFPLVIDDEERIIELYAQAEAQLKRAWGALLEVILKGEHHSAFRAVNSLIDRGKLSPIRGVEKITSLPMEVRQRAQWVRSHLDVARPRKTRNNQVDTIDFAVTWLLNSQEPDEVQRYLSIYTQSAAFMRACTARRELLWEDDYLVRGSQYLKFRTRLQEMFTTVRERQQFVMKWAEKCRQLQREINRLIDLDKELPELRDLHVLDLHMQFDEECRKPLEFAGEFGERDKLAYRKRAEKLYSLLRDEGEFRGKTGDAYEILKTHLRELQKRLSVFTPQDVQTPDAKTYLEKIARWLDSEDQR